MKLQKIKLLKKQTKFIIILEKLKLRGLTKIYNEKKNLIDYLDVAVAVIEFINENKDVYKNLNKKNYKNLIILCLYNFYEESNIENLIDEIYIENILKLLKTNFSTKKSLNIYKLLIMFFSKIKKLLL